MRRLRDAPLVDVGGGMRLLSVGPDAYFPTDHKLHRGPLLVRDFFDDLFDRCATLHDVLLSGVPGTGSSWWVWYALRRIQQMDPAPAVVWQTFRLGRDECVLFKGGRAYVGPRDAFSAELADHSTWWVPG